MSASSPPKGHGQTRYICTNPDQSCPARASISIDLLDPPILTWLQTIIEDPSRANA